MVAVLRVLWRLEPPPVEVARGDRDGFVAWATAAGAGRYVGDTSVKGSAAIDWDDLMARQQFLAGLVADADRLLATVRTTRGTLAAGSAEDTTLIQAAGLLRRVLAQDIARQEARQEGQDAGVTMRRGRDHATRA